MSSRRRAFTMGSRNEPPPTIRFAKPSKNQKIRKRGLTINRNSRRKQRASAEPPSPPLSPNSHATPEQQLKRAIMKQDYAQIAQCLHESNVDPGIGLQAAAAGGDPNIMAMLLDAGADISGPSGYRALVPAAVRGHRDVVLALLNYGVDIRGLSDAAFGQILDGENMEMASFLCDRGFPWNKMLQEDVEKIIDGTIPRMEERVARVSSGLQRASPRPSPRGSPRDKETNDALDTLQLKNGNGTGSGRTIAAYSDPLGTGRQRSGKSPRSPRFALRRGKGWGTDRDYKDSEESSASEEKMDLMAMEIIHQELCAELQEIPPLELITLAYQLDMEVRPLLALSHQQVCDEIAFMISVGNYDSSAESDSE